MASRVYNELAGLQIEIDSNGLTTMNEGPRILWQYFCLMCKLGGVRPKWAIYYQDNLVSVVISTERKFFFMLKK